jgi:hypothetical protein
MAFDDRSAFLASRSLTWYAGRTRLGRGSVLAVTGLAPGLKRIRLVATDRFGRPGTASVLVRLQATSPQFLRLSVPRSLSRRASRLTLRVAATLPSILTIGGQRVALGRKSRTVNVGVARNRRTVKLRLTLKAFGRTTVAPISVRRT